MDSGTSLWIGLVFQVATLNSLISGDFFSIHPKTPQLLHLGLVSTGPRILIRVIRKIGKASGTSLILWFANVQTLLLKPLLFDCLFHTLFLIKVRSLSMPFDSITVHSIRCFSNSDVVRNQQQIDYPIQIGESPRLLIKGEASQINEFRFS